MSGTQAFRSVLASVVLVVLAAAPGYSSHGTGSITALAIDPLNPKTVYAGASEQGVSKSLDGGTTWVSSAGGLTNTSVTSLTIDAQDPSIVYAGTWGGGVFKSVDGGENWSAINTGLPAFNVADLVIEAQTPVTLYALVPDAGVFKSIDGGESWKASLSNDELVGLSGAHTDPALRDIVAGVGTLAIAPRADPGTPATLYVSVSYSACDSFNCFVWGAVFKSTDGGSSWARIGPASDLANDLFNPTWLSAPILAVAPPTPTTPATVYTFGVGWEDIPYVCWTSDDWNFACGRLTVTSVSVSSLVVDPRTPTILYAGTNLGVYKSADAGATWRAANTGLTDSLQSQGVATDVRPLVIDPVTPTTLYAGTKIGVFKSTDGAATWTQHPENCGNGIDDDCDGLVDGADPDCTGCTDCSFDFCPPGFVCGYDGCCISHCGDRGWNGDEGDVDCGGSCASKCQNGQHCWSHFDCQSGSCAYDICTSAIAPSSVSLDSMGVQGGTSSTGTVVLSAPAPAGGAVVVLSSSNTAAARLPASVTVPAGATTANFTVSTSSVTLSTAVTISAVSGGVTRSAAITVTPETTLSTVSVNPPSVAGGTSSTGTVTLSAAAPAGGATVTLSSNKGAAATVPATVTVVAGATSANFTVSTIAVTSSTAVTISGTFGGVTKSAGLTVSTVTASPPPPPSTDKLKRFHHLAEDGHDRKRHGVGRAVAGGDDEYRQHLHADREWARGRQDEHQ